MNRETESGEKGKQTLSAENITDNILVVHETHNMNKGVRMRCKPEKWLSFRLMKVAEIGKWFSWDANCIFPSVFHPGLLLCSKISLQVESKNADVPDEGTSGCRLWFLCTNLYKMYHDFSSKIHVKSAMILSINDPLNISSSPEVFWSVSYSRCFLLI